MDATTVKLIPESTRVQVGTSALVSSRTKVVGTSVVGPQGIQGTQGDWTVSQTLNAQVGTSYSLVSSDVGKLVTLTNAAAITLTVPSGLGLSAGQRVDIAQLGAGQVTLNPSSTTVYSTPTLKLRGQYSACTLICLSTDTYLAVGDFAAV